MNAETVIGPATIVEKAARNYVGIRLTSPFPGLFAQVTRWWKEAAPSCPAPCLRVDTRRWSTEETGSGATRR